MKILRVAGRAFLYSNPDFQQKCLMVGTSSVAARDFVTLGQNALAAYVLHEIVNGAVRVFAPDDSPLWWIVTTFAVYVGITYMFVRHLEKHGIFIRM